MARKPTPKPKPSASTAADWQSQTLSRVRALIRSAAPDAIEQQKWHKPSNPAGVPVWSHPTRGIICTGETYKAAVKLTFPKGAALPDPSRLFNASLEGNARRAIDIRATDTLDRQWQTAFKALIKAATAESSPATKPALRRQTTKTRTVKLLSGGNPQIAKAEGDAPVQAYIKAIPGWKRTVAQRIDALIVQTVPNVRKAVKWNSPFYGIDGQGWFVSFHVFTRYVKVTFFRGTSLHPAPTGGTAKEARWIDLHEHDLNEQQLTAWIKQAAAIPGWLA